uniref:Uncharacterized protein n=1 Tax=Palisada sp. TaxID=1955416 RepID=A0A1Z1MRU5_9FLOR|nr:hypothetical protein [Palisada sp.]
MRNKIYFNQKLDLLVISLKTLETLEDNNLINTLRNTDKKNNYEKRLRISLIDSLELYLHLKKDNKIVDKYFTKIIKYMYKVHKHINIYLLSKKANLILKLYINYQESHKLKQYIRKFNYLYFKEDKYYNKYKNIEYSKTTELNKIALTNLFLITKLIKKQGIYSLTKYLSN